jgi:hypothetical protein
MKVQISIEHLKNAIKIAEDRQKHDSSLSNILEISVRKKSDTHCGQDDVEIRQKSVYAECVSTLIGY